MFIGPNCSFFLTIKIHFMCIAMLWGIFRVTLDFQRLCFIIAPFVKLVQKCFLVCRFKVGVSDIIRSQYTDQVGVAHLIVSVLLL